MRFGVAELAGLVIGFALGGAALAHFLPQLEQMRQPAPVVRAAPAPVPPRPTIVHPQPVANAARPAPSPGIATVLTPDPEPLPNVIHPEAPPERDAPPPTPGTGSAGTGFFVSYDGIVMTAAHVVNACRSAEIISPFVKRTPATVISRETRHDIALLRVEHGDPPAILAIGRPAAGSEQLFVLGYPARSGLRAPEETWATLENSRLPGGAGSPADPREMVWLEASAITHGYSGGPILDPRAGVVVGIVRATVDGKAMAGIRGMPTSGIAIGPGAGELASFLRQEEPDTGALAADRWGNDPLDVARRATVHVICWH